MKSKLLGTLLFFIVLVPGMASADLIINDLGLEVRGSGYVVTAGDGAEFLYDQFLAGSDLGCDTSIVAVDNVGSSQTCGGPVTDIASLISVSIEQTGGEIMWEFGADWGRGGTISEMLGWSTPAEAPYVGDYWWALNWASADVINFSTFVTGSFDFFLLGFEGCCGGGMSLRYSENGGESWNIAAVNAVPEPGTLALLGLGLAAFGFAKRRKV